MELSVLEIVGYVGFIMVALSLSMKEIKWLRIFNLIGAIIFVIYGTIKGGMLPVVVLNAYLTITNLYHLFKLQRS